MVSGCIGIFSIAFPFSDKKHAGMTVRKSVTFSCGTEPRSHGPVRIANRGNLSYICTEQFDSSEARNRAFIIAFHAREGALLVEEGRL